MQISAEKSGENTPIPLAIVGPHVTAWQRYECHSTKPLVHLRRTPPVDICIRPPSDPWSERSRAFLPNFRNGHSSTPRFSWPGRPRLFEGFFLPGKKKKGALKKAAPKAL